MSDEMSSAGTDPRVLHNPDEFAAALTLLRQRRGLSIRALAKLADVPSATLGGYFSSRHLPSLTQPHAFYRVLRALGVREEALPAWREALIRVKQNASRRGGIATAPPYRGLRPFTEQDADLFFGRGQVVRMLVQLVADSSSASERLLFLVGPSGSGKSSVLRAGVAAEFTRHDEMAVAVILPGVDPGQALDEAVAALAHAQGHRSLLIIDQAEEIFSPEVSPSSRAHFLATLTGVTTGDEPIVVLMGMRADFYAQAASEPALLRALQESQVLLGAMPLDGLREAIVRPCEEAKVGVDEELVHLLIRDLEPVSGRYDPGALPLVSHALLATWEHRRGAGLTVSDYLAVGGLRSAVAQTAEQVFDGFDPAARQAAQWLFARLVLADSQQTMTRRRLDREALHHPDPGVDAVLVDVVEAFVAGRLLTADETTIEISHEALLTAWPRLHEWVLEDVDTGRLQAKIAHAAREWEDSRRDPDMLLRGGPLLDAAALADAPASTARTLTTAESAFVRASADRAAQNRLTEARRAKTLRTIVAVTTVFAILSTLLAAAAWRARDEADAQRQTAELQRTVAEQSTALTQAAIQTRDRDPAVSLQVATALNELAPSDATRSIVLSSTSKPVPVRFLGPEGPIAAAVSPDGSLVALSGVDGLTRLWRRNARGGYDYLRELPDHNGQAPALATEAAFDPAGSLLAVAVQGAQGAPAKVLVWDVGTPERAIASASFIIAGQALSLAFAEDGSRLAVGTDAGLVHVWRVRSEESGAGSRVRLGDDVTAVAFTGSGAVMTATRAGSVARLSGRDRLRVQLLDGGFTVTSPVMSFLRGGRQLAVAQRDDVAVWRTHRGQVTRSGRLFSGTRSPAVSLGASADGRTLAVATSDGHVRVYAVRSRALQADLRTPTAATGIHLTSDARGLLSAEPTGKARLWPLPVPVLRGFDDAIYSLASAVDGRLMAAAGHDEGTIRLFGPGAGTVPVLSQRLRTAAGLDGAAAMSADGVWVAAGTQRGGVVLWRYEDPTGYRRATGARLGDELVESVAFSGDGRLLAAVDNAGELAVWRLRNAARPERVGQVRLGADASSVALDPQGTLVAAGTGSGSVRLFELGRRGLIETPALPVTGGGVSSVAFDPSGDYLAVGTGDESVRVWQVKGAGRGPVGQALSGPGATVHAVAWNWQASLLAAASADGKVWLWDTSSLSDIRAWATLDGASGPLYAVTFTTAGALLAGGADRVITTWQTDVDALAASVCDRAGAGLTQSEWQQLVPTIEWLPVC